MNIGFCEDQSRAIVRTRLRSQGGPKSGPSEDPTQGPVRKVSGHMSE